MEYYFDAMVDAEKERDAAMKNVEAKTNELEEMKLQVGKHWRIFLEVCRRRTKMTTYRQLDYHSTIYDDYWALSQIEVY